MKSRAATRKGRSGTPTRLAGGREKEAPVRLTGGCHDDKESVPIRLTDGHYEEDLQSLGGMPGLLTEDDSDQQLLSLEGSADASANGWVKMTVVVDSGAGDNVTPDTALPFIPTAATEKSRAGKGFRGATGKKNP